MEDGVAKQVAANLFGEIKEALTSADGGAASFLSQATSEVQDLLGSGEPEERYVDAAYVDKAGQSSVRGQASVEAKRTSFVMQGKDNSGVVQEAEMSINAPVNPGYLRGDVLSGRGAHR